MNPGFETGDLTGWTLTKGSVGCTDFSVGGSGTGPHSGSYAAEFGDVCAGDYDTISQALPTVVGTPYTFNFYLAGADGSNNGQQVFWNGNLILNLTNFSQNYTLYTFTETASTSSTTIAFAGYNAPSWNGVDDVSVTASTVPEPASLVLLGLGSAAMVVLRRRRSGTA